MRRAGGRRGLVAATLLGTSVLCAGSMQCERGAGAGAVLVGPVVGLGGMRLYIGPLAESHYNLRLALH